MTLGIITLVSVTINALAAVFAPIVARKFANERNKFAEAEEVCDVLSSGLRVIEQAVEDNKDALAQTGAGDHVCKTIRTYGPAARQLVSAARDAARTLRVGEPVEASADDDAPTSL